MVIEGVLLKVIEELILILDVIVMLGVIDILELSEELTVILTLAVMELLTVILGVIV